MKQDVNIESQFIGTVFDRQVRISDWNQKTISSHTALCLGAGGLGSVVILNLLRLGLKKIIIVDYDKVDIHNLNRQILYSIKDVGQSKVKSCIKNSQFHNIGNTQVVGFEGCVLSNWQKIIQFARQSNVIFNMIDYGDWFDLACQSLALKFKLPLVQGGTYAVTLTVDYFSPLAKPCALCLNPIVDKEILQMITPDKILQIDSLKFLPKNDNPVGRSFVGVCTICGQYMICLYLNSFLFHEGRCAPTQRMIFYTSSFEMVNFPLEPEKNCQFCGDPDSFDVKEKQSTENIPNKTDGQKLQQSSENSSVKKQGGQKTIQQENSLPQL